nr:sulfotransferase family 2 domain-containing protein [Halomonas sp. MCCC 1A11057]
MLVLSHFHKTIFVHIPKCGGQSIEDIYIRETGLTWKNRAPLLLRKRADGESAPPRLAHLTIKEYLENKYVSNEMFDSYFKFSVIRNPYTRVVSFYKYMGFSDKISINEFCQEYLVKFNSKKHAKYWFYMPQVNFLLMRDGRVGIDKLLRLENLQEDWERSVLSLTNVVTSKVPHVNISKESDESTRRTDYLRELNKKSFEVINRLYDKDFLFFNYERRLY